MVTEIQHHDIGTVLYNISTTTLPLTLTKAKKRWRRAYFTIHFSNTLVSIAKNIIEIIPQLVVPEVRININEVSDHHFYGICQTQLINIVQNKDLETLRRIDGVKGLAKTLHTHLENGIDCQDLNERTTVFGSNTYEKPPPKGLFYFVAEAFKDVTIVILMGCAALSLGFSIKEDGIKDGWYEGGSILLAVFLVIVVSAISNFRQEKQDIKIDVVREGRRQKISIFDIVVGDIVILKVGDQIPVDGLFIDGHSLMVDESSMTGESEQIQVNAITNPFLISGAKVVVGLCRMLVLSVGMNTARGKMISSITSDNNEQTPLQSRLNKAALAVTFLVGIVMLIFYFKGGREDENGNRKHDGKHTSINNILDSLMGMFAIVVVAIPEGLPLVVTLTLSYSMKRVTACETIGSATTGKTRRTLTMNQMVVTTLLLGMEYLEPHSSNVMALQVLELLHQGVGLNTMSTVFKHGSREYYSGSPIDKAILSWAIEDLGMDMKKLKQSSTILVETFNWKKKRSGVSIKRKDDSTIHVNWKGDAKMVLPMCSRYYNSHGHKVIMDSHSRTKLENIIEGMAASGLRCIAFAHKKVPEGTPYPTLTEEGLNLLGIVGLKDPCRPECRIFESEQEECEEEVEGVQFDDFTNEVAEQSSDVAILDDDIASVSTLLMRGLCEYGNIQKFIQFQVTANVGALFINFSAAVTSSGACLTAVQLLWVNLIMDTLGSLALATERPTKKPSVSMIKFMRNNLFALAVFQIIVLLTFHFNGKVIFNVEERVKNAIIFNIFVLCQVFNEFNSRKFKKRNIFKGIHKNKLFVGIIIGMTIILQIVMVKFFKNLSNTSRSNGVQWGISIAIAALSWSSQKEDASNSENNLLTMTFESIMKRTKKTKSEGLKNVLERLRASDELLKPLANVFEDGV